MNTILKDSLNALAATNEVINEQRKSLYAFFRKAMGAKGAKALLNEDDALMFDSYGYDGVSLMEVDIRDVLTIDGINILGEPIFSESRDELTGTWGDLPVEKLIETATLIGEIFEEKKVEMENKLPLTDETLAKINEVIDSRYHSSDVANIGRFNDNNVKKAIYSNDLGNIVVEGKDCVIRVRHFSPQSQGDKQSLAWSLVYDEEATKR